MKLLATDTIQAVLEQLRDYPDDYRVIVTDRPVQLGTLRDIYAIGQHIRREQSWGRV